jgi:hypothetical protein
VSGDDPPKRSRCRETPGPPVMSRGALVSAGRPRGESRESEPGTHEVRVHVIIRQVAEVGWTHRASCPPGGRKTCWRLDRALARKKLEALPDAEHEQKDGESVRGRAFTIKSNRSFGLWASARKFFNTTEGVSGLLPS